VYKEKIEIIIGHLFAVKTDKGNTFLWKMLDFTFREIPVTF